MVGRQLLLRLLHCPTQGKLPLVGVVMQDMVLNLHIVDVPGLQHLDAACQRQDDALPLPALRPADGLGQLHGEHVIVHRLQQEVQRVHLVAVDGVLSHLGDEHQHRLLVHLPDAPGRFHAVHIRHGDVQQDDVILRPIVLYQIHSAGEAGDLHLRGVGLPILPQKLRQLRTGFRFVLCNSNPQHGIHPLLIQKIVSLIPFLQFSIDSAKTQAAVKGISGRHSAVSSSGSSSAAGTICSTRVRRMSAKPVKLLSV